jgi:hypothetical protein
MEPIDLNKDVESPCELTRDWGFVGYMEKGRGSKRHEVSVPIGVYGSYRDGAAHANAWMKATAGALRWEGQRLYRPMSDDTVMTPERAEA